MKSSKNKSAFTEGLVIYEIYPRSFMDSSGDGIGDLKGIISKLNYLQELGVSAIWLCPIYPSPMIDFGYDISDHKAIDPLFGTLEDLDQLIKESHKRGIKLILDLVVNHTSDQHQWFKEARVSKTNDKRNWYVWRDKNASGGPPNNWLSVFGGSAWEYDQATDQYYLHSFATQQPDLNWDNINVRHAIKDIMHFWLKRGVDGFRVDAASWFAKDPDFADDPLNPAITIDHPPSNAYDRLLHTHSMAQPRLYEYLRELCDVLEEYDDRFMIIEAHFDMLYDVDSYVTFYENIDNRVAAPFNFIDLYLPWSASSFKEFFDEFQEKITPPSRPRPLPGMFFSKIS